MVYMGVGWLGWTTVLAAAAVVVLLNDADSPRRQQIQSAAWGVLLSGLLYVMYQHYTAADVQSLVGWLIGPGFLWIGLLFIAIARYAADQAAGRTSDAGSFVQIVRQSVAQPVERLAGTFLGTFISFVLLVVTVASIAAEALGFGVGLFAMEPGFGAATLTAIIGYIGVGGTVPLLGPYLPGWMTGMNPMQFLGFVLVIFAIAMALWSEAFQEALSGGR